MKKILIVILILLTAAACTAKEPKTVTVSELATNPGEFRYETVIVTGVLELVREHGKVASVGGHNSIGTEWHFSLKQDGATFEAVDNTGLSINSMPITTYLSGTPSPTGTTVIVTGKIQKSIEANTPEYVLMISSVEFP